MQRAKVVLVTGGTGFIGSALVPALLADGHRVRVLSRQPRKVRFGEALGSLADIDDDARIDAIINLAGAPIDRRWSDAYKKVLVDSRTGTTRELLRLLQRLHHRPEVLISASAVGWYGAHGTEPLDEQAAPKDEFTHQLCAQWESLAREAKSQGLRVCIARLGVVLARDGGALKKMLPAFRCGLGGRLGSGRQMFSWIHRDDVVNAVQFLLDDPDQAGTFNLTAPRPVSNAEFTAELASALHRPAILPMPAPVVRLLFGEMGDRLLLHGQNVLPVRLQGAGFSFRYPTLGEALGEIFQAGPALHR